MQTKLKLNVLKTKYYYPYKVIYLLLLLFGGPSILLFTLFLVYILPCFHLKHINLCHDLLMMTCHINFNESYVNHK